MKINLPKQKALSLLNDRLRELPFLKYETSDAWKSRTIAEMRSIFIPGDNRYNEFFFFHFHEYSFWEDRKKAESLLDSYIGFINDNVPDPVAVPIKDEVLELKVKLDNMQSSNMAYDRKNRELESRNTTLSSELSAAKQTVCRLQENIFQTENLNAPKLWKLFWNLPGSLQIAVIGIVVSIFLGGIFVGVALHKLGLYGQ